MLISTESSGVKFQPCTQSLVNDAWNCGNRGSAIV